MLVFLKVLVLVSFVISYRVSEKRYDEDIALVQDVPLKSDLHALLASLKRTIKYCHKRKTDIDMNLMFGLFLSYVNLKSSLFTNNNLPTILRSEIYKLLKQINELLQYFKRRKPVDRDLNGRNHLNITPFLGEMSWTNRLGRFKKVRRNELIFRPESHSGRSDPDWQHYLKKMLDFEQWIPNPKISNYCMSSLINSRKTPERKCKVSNICHHMLRNGTNFGYALTHRLLFLINARSARGCSIYSPTVDKIMRHEFCKRAHEEAEYIAVHDFDYIDLLMEQIALCSLDGHSEFLHHSWVKRIIQHQAPHGCFGDYLQRLHRRRAKNWFKIDHNFVKGVCNMHVTGVAAASLGAAIRFIIEMYYT